MGMFDAALKELRAGQELFLGVLRELLAEVRETNRLLRERADGGGEG